MVTTRRARGLKLVDILDVGVEGVGLSQQRRTDRQTCQVFLGMGRANGCRSRSGRQDSHVYISIGCLLEATLGRR